LYFIRDKFFINNKLAFGLFLLSFFYLAMIMINPQLLPFSKNESENKFYGFNLLFSWNYQADFLFSLIVAANIYFLFSMSKAVVSRIHVGVLHRVHSTAMKIGNCSYTLYLFHLPLLFLFASVFPYDKTNHFHQLGIMFLVLTCIFFIAKYTEWKVLLWRSMVESVFEKGIKFKQFLVVRLIKA
jgi:hypothetical protein